MKLIDILVQELPKRGEWPDGVNKISSHATGRVFFDGNFAPQGFSLPRADDGWHQLKHPFSYTNGVTREQYEYALAAKNDGWIDWAGGECPVDTKTLVDIRLKVGFTYKSCHPGDYSWRHAGGGGDIIAYRLHKPMKSEQVRADAWNAYAGTTEADDEADLSECIGQDAAPVWNGEGLPPVGCECECECQFRGEWQKCTILFSGKRIVVVMVDDDEYPFESKGSLFRPTRSEAEQKRDEAVKAIMLTGWCQNAAEEIYDLIAAGKVPGMKLED